MGAFSGTAGARGGARGSLGRWGGVCGSWWDFGSLGVLGLTGWQGSVESFADLGVPGGFWCPWGVLGSLGVSGGFWWFLVGLGVPGAADSAPRRGRPLLPLGQPLLDKGPGLSGPSGPPGPLGAPPAPTLRRGLRGCLVVPQLPLRQPERALWDPPRPPGTRGRGCHGVGDWGYGGAVGNLGVWGALQGAIGHFQGAVGGLGRLWEWIGRSRGPSRGFGGAEGI